MNQQREVIYSLRAFALEGGQETMAEGLRMIESAVRKRVETNLAEYERAEDWDMPLLQQELLIHYLLSVPELQDPDHRPVTIPDAAEAAVVAARRAFEAKLESLNQVKDQSGAGYADRLLCLVMLNVIDEKWKDHLYDLDQLRNSIQYRSYGQKDPLVEYKEEAYAMFVDLMNDLYTTFTERFLKVQLVIEPAAPPTPAPRPELAAPRKRFNAMGVVEEDGAGAVATGVEETMDVAPAEAPASGAVARRDPLIVGAGKTRPISAPSAAGTDWSTVGRNDPCPCGSGKKFKKCHGANA
jgi:preprotein translocase subunit SecA